MTKHECVSCGTHFRINIKPEYCPACGNPKNEQFGMSIAESNPNITGFIKHE
jgi:ribosomal protein L37E